MTESGTPEKIGKINRKLIVDYVRKYGPASRADIQRTLNMSFPTVSANVKRLLETKQLLEAGDGDNAIGRKSTLLMFNALRAYVIGVDFGRSQIRVMLADLEGVKIDYLKEDCGAGGQQTTDQLCRMIDEITSRSGIDRSLVRCIGIGVPGVWDARMRRLFITPFMDGIDLDRAITELSSRYNARIFVENSVNYGAVGERWCGVAQGYDDIVYINFGVGIGSALILNGQLYHGANGASGEIGFMVPETRYFREQFHEIGVLESLVAGSKIRQQLEDRGLDPDIGTILRENGEKGAEQSELLRRVTDYIGMALINITATVNEELIVIGGGLGALLSDTCIPVWKSMLEAHVPFVPKIVTTALRERANVYGAVAAAIRYVNDNDPEFSDSEE